MKTILVILSILLCCGQAGATNLAGVSQPFGNGTDGAFNSASAITAVTPATTNGPIIKQYSSFSLNTGHAISPTSLNKGIYIFVNGTATISGAITQTNKCAPNHGYGAGNVLHDLSNKTLISGMEETAHWSRVYGGMEATVD